MKEKYGVQMRWLVSAIEGRQRPLTLVCRNSNLRQVKSETEAVTFHLITIYFTNNFNIINQYHFHTLNTRNLHLNKMSLNLKKKQKNYTVYLITDFCTIFVQR